MLNKFVYKKPYAKFSHTIDQTRIMMDEEKEKTKENLNQGKLTSFFQVVHKDNGKTTKTLLDLVMYGNNRLQ